MNTKKLKLSTENQHFDNIAVGNDSGSGSTPGPASNLQQDISTLYLNQTFSDIVFIVQGQRIYAHKVIMAVRSLYFKTLLYGGFAEASKSEIPLTDVSAAAFRQYLKFIYTDQISIGADNLNLILEVLDMANKFCVQYLEALMVKRLFEIMNVGNVCQIIQRAQLYNYSKLYNSCFDFIETRAVEFLRSPQFKDQPEEILTQILQKDTLRVREIEIFKAVAGWCQNNKRTKYDLLDCVRFSLLSLAEIELIVKPTNLVDEEVLAAATSQFADLHSRIGKNRLTGVNLANREYQAEMVVGQKDFNFLLDGNQRNDTVAMCPIRDTSAFVVRLGFLSYVNSINMLLHVGSGNKFYRYYIESSIDGEIWKTILNHTNADCRGLQELYFESEAIQFLRVVGTYSSAGDTLDIVSFEVYSKDPTPDLMNGFVCPSRNVALLSKHAIVAKGCGSHILNGNPKSNFDTYHAINRDSIVIQLAQPYMMDFIKLRLYDEKERHYKYYIETSLDKSEWTMIADRTNDSCSSWQILHFIARPIVYIRITGTYSSQGYDFRCCHLECFMQTKKTNSSSC